MIVSRGPNLLRMLAGVGTPLLLLLLWDCAVVLAFRLLHWQWLSHPHIPVALLGSAIGVLLGFRNTTSYSRWWQARTLWGAIVNGSRTWGRQVVANVRWMKPADRETVVAVQGRLIYLQIAFVHALRQQLRGLSPLDELRGLLSEDDLAALAAEANVPYALQVQQAHLLRECLERDWLDSLQWSALNGTLDRLADAQGGTERLKNTPMPRQYDFYPRLFLLIYCVLLPLALVENMGWATPLGSTLAGFIFLALDRIGRDLEDPFDNKIFDVPMSAIARTIETNLRQALGEKQLPEAPAPVDGVLW